MNGSGLLVEIPAPVVSLLQGFGRLLVFLTGISNIRDVIPFARTPGNAEF